MFLTLISFSWHDLNKVRLLENGHIYCFGMYPAILGHMARGAEILTSSALWSAASYFVLKKNSFTA